MYLNTVLYKTPTGVVGLTLTWDVFKFNSFITIAKPITRLTLTWDVFKLT